MKPVVTGIIVDDELFTAGWLGKPVDKTIDVVPVAELAVRETEEDVVKGVALPLLLVVSTADEVTLAVIGATTKDEVVVFAAGLYGSVE